MVATGEAAFDGLVERVRQVFFVLRALSEATLEGLDCTPVERGILKEIAEGGPRSVPELAESRHISRQAMQKAIDRMMAADLVVARPNPRHRKSLLLSPTAGAGTQLLREIRVRERSLFAKVAVPVAEAEMRRAASTLASVAERLTQPDVMDLATRLVSKRNPQRPARQRGRP